MYYGSGNQVSALKAVILILVGIGLVLGLAMIGSDFANPVKSIAEYQQAQVERQRLARQNEIDLQQHETLQEATTQAKMAKLQEDIRFLQETHDQDLRQQEMEIRHLQDIYGQELQQREVAARHQEELHNKQLQQAQERAALRLHLSEVAAYAITGTLVVFLLTLGIGLSVYVARRRPVRAESTVDVWTPERKREAIKAARWRERMQREHERQEQEIILERRLKALLRPRVRPNGHDEPEQMSSRHALAPDCN